MAVAIGFLTRFPVPRGQPDEADFGRAIAWFPLAGVLLGAVLLGLDRMAGGRLPVTVEAVLLVALLAALTGGLHLDGLADVFDGLGGGRGDRARILEIMRDSRIGAHGATALLLALLLKAVSLAVVLERGMSPALVAFPAVARLGVAVLVFAFPYARPEGLGRAFKSHGRPVHLAVAVATTAAVLAATGRATLAPAAAALAAALLFAAWVSRRLGGLTGDVYGAGVEVAEVAFLVAACVG